MRRRNRKGQNTLEYVLLIVAVVGAFLAIQHYLNRGLQGRMRDSTDNIGEQFDSRLGSVEYTTTRKSYVTETNIEGVTRSELFAPEETYRKGGKTIKAVGSAPAPQPE